MCDKGGEEECYEEREKRKGRGKVFRERGRRKEDEGKEEQRGQDLSTES
jgi:hypothetical protein